MAQLKAAWTALINGGPANSLRRDYVRAYFLLLQACLAGYSRGEIGFRVLRKVVAFETFHISGQCAGSVAGLFSTRNPAYLLGMVAAPDAPDNPKYLPLICPSVDCSKPATLYHHYRRISLGGVNGTQLFVYPPIGNRDCESSYSLLAQFFQCLTPRTDPWIRERSQSLYAGVFAPLVAASTPQRLKLLDVACGSAMITMRLCKKTFATHHKSFDLTLVDVAQGNKAIANVFYRNLHAFGNVVYRRENLFRWLDRCSVDSQAHFDIALLLRICDIFSRFSIQNMSYDKAESLIRQNSSRCDVGVAVLHPERLIACNRLDDIQHGVGRFAFNGGSAFRQFSLSEYFRAIHTIMGGGSLPEETSVYIAVRTFDKDALVLPSGISMIERLTSIADRLIVEDADMSTSHLQRHVDDFGLVDLSITNMTERTAMRGAAVHLIAKRSPKR